MSEQVKPYKSLEKSKKEQVELMFDNISGNYDLLNRVLSFGIDTVWRKKAIAYLKPLQPKQLVDIATGTGDFAFEAYKQLKPDKIIGVDLSEGMLSLGRKKITAKGLDTVMEFIKGDSEGLPLKDNNFDAATVAFGVRNFENLKKGLADIYRTLKPGGMLVVLEFSKPKQFPVMQLYGFYNKFILPGVGKMVSKDASAYTYLPESVAAFPEGKDFLNIMESVGFNNNFEKRLTFGICSIYTGRKPA